jgi:large subunit ribosomal protein L10
MTRQEKEQFISELSVQLKETNVIYLADTADLNAGSANDLRRECFKGGVKLQVVKNTLLKRAMEQTEEKEFAEMYDLLKGPTSVMFAGVGNAPAKVIQKFRKKHDKPILKGAYIDSGIYVGDDKVMALAALKSKEEMVGEVIASQKCYFRFTKWRQHIGRLGKSP